MDCKPPVFRAIIRIKALAEGPYTGLGMDSRFASRLRVGGFLIFEVPLEDLLVTRAVSRRITVTVMPEGYTKVFVNIRAFKALMEKVIVEYENQ